MACLCFRNSRKHKLRVFDALLRNRLPMEIVRRTFALDRIIVVVEDAIPVPTETVHDAILVVIVGKGDHEVSALVVSSNILFTVRQRPLAVGAIRGRKGIHPWRRTSSSRHCLLCRCRPIRIIYWAHLPGNISPMAFSNCLLYSPLVHPTQHFSPWRQ